MAYLWETAYFSAQCDEVSYGDSAPFLPTLFPSQDVWVTSLPPRKEGGPLHQEHLLAPVL